MAFHAIITCKIDDNLWGISEFIASLGNVSKADRNSAIVEFLQEDITALIDNAEWEIKEW
jgi:hypothetical protein